MGEHAGKNIRKIIELNIKSIFILKRLESLLSAVTDEIEVKIYFWSEINSQCL